MLPGATTVLLCPGVHRVFWEWVALGAGPSSLWMKDNSEEFLELGLQSGETDGAPGQARFLGSALPFGAP